MSLTRKLSLALITLLLTGFALAGLPRMRSATARDINSSGHVAVGIEDGSLANDDFANAEVITGNAGSVAGTNAGATLEAGEPAHMGSTFDQSVWYTWQAPAENVAVTFDTL